MSTTPDFPEWAAGFRDYVHRLRTTLGPALHQFELLFSLWIPSWRLAQQERGRRLRVGLLRARIERLEESPSEQADRLLEAVALEPFDVDLHARLDGGRRRPPPPPVKPRVELRRVKGALELRIDGTQASVYRPGRGVTGVVWWTLASPVLLLPRNRQRRVLLLGLAAGSVAQAVRALDPAAEIVGVEWDREVLRLARRHFGLGRVRLEVVRGDALDYLRKENRRFDLIVEDLFVGPPRTVRKPDWLLGEGYRLISRRLRRGGFVVSNTIHETRQIVRAMRPFGGRVVSMDVRGHWNRVTVCGRDLPEPRALRRRLARRPETARFLPRVRLRSLWEVSRLNSVVNRCRFAIRHLHGVLSPFESVHANRASSGYFPSSL